MTPLVLCTLMIIVTLAVSGIAKAKDRASTAAAIVNLKLDRWLPLKAVSRFLPWGEIALALWLLLVPGWAAILGGIAAVLLFAAYWIVIARAVFTGNTASCNCFGGASDAPVSGYTLARNTALLGAAMGTLVAAIQTHTSALGMLFRADGESWLWLLSALFVAGALWSMYRSELLAEKTNAPAQEISPEFAQPATSSELMDDEVQEYVRLPIPHGTLEKIGFGTFSLRELAQSQARVLFFVSPGCGPCVEVLSNIEKWQEKLPQLKLNPVVADQAQVPLLKLSEEIEVLVDQGFNTEILFGRGTPLAVALGADGLLAGGPVMGSFDVISFMEEIIGEFEAA